MSQPAIDTIVKWRKDALLFVREVFRVEPDPWQAEFLGAFSDPSIPMISLNACKGPGKSCALAWAGWQFLFTRPFPKIPCTSVTGENLYDNLWTEFAKWMKKSELLSSTFTWTQSRIFHNEHHQNWWATAATWPKNANEQQQADSLAGYHADYICFLMDETGSYPESVMTTALASQASGIEKKIVQAGNPSHLTGPLYLASTRDRKKWYVINITGDPEDPNRSQRIDKKYAQDMIDTYGRDNDWVKINILGQFPNASENQLISPDDVERAIRRKPDEHQYSFAKGRIGIDMARFGHDPVILSKRKGIMAYPMISIMGERTNSIVGRIMHEHNEFRSEMQFIDGTGGFHVGVEDALLSAGMNVTPVHFNWNAYNKEKYANRRAEMWVTMAEWIRKRGCIPDDPELKQELTAPTYRFDLKGRMQLESKDEIKKRLGRSVDKADALALTFGLPDLYEERPERPELWDMPGVSPRKKQEFAKSDWDPLSNH